jgi:peptide/nickel transport system permease protein
VLPEIAVARTRVLEVHAPATVAAREAPRGHPLWQLALRRPLIVWPGAYLLVLILVAAILPPVLHIDPYAQNLADSLYPPFTPGHILGTDQLGRDLLLRLIDGARTSLSVGLIAVAIALVVGGAIGLVAGFSRGTLDEILMRLVDVKLAFPGILAALVIVTVLGSGLDKAMIAVGLGAMPRYARVIRGCVLSTREEPYVEAAISVGSSLPKIMWRHLMPNTIAPLIVQGTYVCASAILTEAILSFLGAGISPETPTWGNIMAEGRQYFQIKPSLIFWPGLLLSIAILSVNLIGDAARDALDPRMKQREGGK